MTSREILLAGRRVVPERHTHCSSRVSVQTFNMLDGLERAALHAKSASTRWTVKEV